MATNFNEKNGFTGKKYGFKKDPWRHIAHVYYGYVEKTRGNKKL